MADIVLGVGTSHTPQITVPWQEWPNLTHNEEVSTYIPPDLDRQLQPEVHKERYEAAQRAVKTLSQKLRATEGLDAIVIFGDDQHEQFYDENMPAIAVYHGGDFGLKTQRMRNREMRHWMELEEANWEKTQRAYSTHSELAKHLITSLTDPEFEVTRCSELREGVGIGHAFSFLYRRLWPDCGVPI